MPETVADYVNVIHEMNRAEFFGTVPNYLANLQLEKDRMDTENPSWATNPGLQQQITNKHSSNKYGSKKGSPNQEV